MEYREPIKELGGKNVKKIAPSTCSFFAAAIVGTHLLFFLIPLFYLFLTNTITDEEDKKGNLYVWSTSRSPPHLEQVGVCPFTCCGFYQCPFSEGRPYKQSNCRCISRISRPRLHK